MARLDDLPLAAFVEATFGDRVSLHSQEAEPRRYREQHPPAQSS